jgi:vacuolar-type H+-ATPase subunit I/STV1
MVDDDANKLVENDAKKARKAVSNYRSGNWKPSAARLLEQTMWLGCIASVLFIVAALPWVGPDKLIPGTMWMGLGSLGIVGFGACAYMVRLVSISFNDADRKMSQKFERGR